VAVDTAIKNITGAKLDLIKGPMTVKINLEAGLLVQA